MDKAIIKAANEGNVYAMLAIAYLYQRGITVDCDMDEAIGWYTRSADHGCPRAKWELAKIYYPEAKETGVTRNYLPWIMAASDAGIPEAQMVVMSYYFNGQYLEKDEARAAELLLSVAESGSPMGEFYLGNAYLHGIVFEKNADLAETYFSRARSHGDAEFFVKIGTKLEYGLDGIAVDLPRAIGWYRLSAEMGFDQGYYCWMAVKKAINGGRHESPEERDRKLAKLPSALEKQERDNLIHEGDYALDEGDFDTALEKYEAAADLGNPDALYMLAVLYHDGEIVRRNDSRAYDYLGRAALAGSTDAQMYLGKSYEIGKGRPKDLNLAMTYYAMAVANGFLVGYYELSRYMERPEKFVRERYKIVR